MSSPYDLIRITSDDLKKFSKDPKGGKIGTILRIVLSELPEKEKRYIRFLSPELKAIEGFEDKFVKGYEVRIKGNRTIEKFLKNFIPFFLLMKK